MNSRYWDEMTVPKKIEWVFQYYGIKILAVLGAVLTVGYLIVSVVFAPKVSDVCILMLTDQVPQETANDYQAALADELGKTVSIEAFGESDLYGKQAFATKVGTDIIDLVIVPKEEAQLLDQSHYLLSYAPLEGTSYYMGVTRRAREGDALQQAMTYLEDVLTKSN